MTRRLTWTEAFPGDPGPVAAGAHVLDGDHFPHAHAFHEIVLVLGGAGSHRTLRGERSLGAGDLLSIRPGAWHAYAGCAGLAVVNLALDPAFVAWLVPEPRLRWLLRDGPAAPRRRGTLVRRLPLPDPDPLLAAEGLARTARALDLLLTLPIRPETEPPSGPAETALRAMEDDPFRPWTLAALAARAGCSPGHLARRWRAEVGGTPMADLERMRLEAVARRLRTEATPVGEIAAECGFEDANYLSRRFRRRYGVSPTAYRADGAGILSG